MSLNNPKYYSDVNIKKDPSYYDYENFEITFGYIFIFIEIKKDMKLIKKLEEESILKYLLAWTQL
jgi:hypothetical protein